MQISTTRRLILDAAIDRSVIRGTLTGSAGHRHDFHGWLELNTALEAMLDTGADPAPNDSGTVPRSQPGRTRRPPLLPPRKPSTTAGGPGDDAPAAGAPTTTGYIR